MQLQDFKRDFHSFKPIIPHVKPEMERFMKLVPVNTAWGFAINDFMDNKEAKTDADYQQLLNEILADIDVGPFMMRRILGPSFPFFFRLAA